MNEPKPAEMMTAAARAEAFALLSEDAAVLARIAAMSEAAGIITQRQNMEAAFAATTNHEQSTI